MKKKYIFSLSLISVLLVALIALQIHYGLWQIEHQTTDLAITESGCVEIIYSDEKTFNLINPVSIKDEDGPRTTPKTIAVKNNCSTVKTVEVTMDVLSTSTIDSSKIKVYVNGDYTLEPTILNTLKQPKNTNELIKEKRLLVKYDLAPNTINRLNIRMWLDGDATSTSDKNTFYTNYYLTANEQIIKPTLAEKIIADNGGEAYVVSKGIPDFKEAATTDEGLYKLNNNYYYRGAVLNNNFRFANLNFKIIGINPDKSLKIIYNDAELLSTFNDQTNQEENLALANSTLEQFLQDWYTNNLQSFDEYIIENNFCNDTSYSNYYARTNFGAYIRLYETLTPSLTCEQTDKTYGGIYSSKVGLITADEAVLAGASKDVNNDTYYLYYNGASFYTMSPSYFHYTAYMTSINKYGKLESIPTNYQRAIRPVINLNASLNIKGNGTIETPYELDLED